MYNKAFIWYNRAFFIAFFREKAYFFRNLSIFILTLAFLCYMMFDRQTNAKKKKASIL